MSYVLLCLAVFLAAYLLNAIYVTVFYHRGLTHGSVTLSPFMRKFVALSGNWVTGLDPKGWSCMHRMHHRYSDTEKDPHSPKYAGVFPLALTQLQSYNRTLSGLIRNDPTYTSEVPDLDFPVSFLNRKKLWVVPYLTQAGIALAIGFAGWGWWLAYAYYAGIMSHPIQGWMVNALAHRYGYRNFETPDESRNNTIVALLVFGEGYQNNHHERPQSAIFSYKWWEIDSGYALCWIAEALGMITINRQPKLVPATVA